MILVSNSIQEQLKKEKNQQIGAQGEKYQSFLNNKSKFT